MEIEFVAAHGTLSETGNNQFSPDAGITRGMFLPALGRLAGIINSRWFYLDAAGLMQSGGGKQMGVK